MPVNKNAQFRYQILDRCFSDYRHKYDFDDLLEKVNEHLMDVRGRDSMIKERQLRDDINAMRKMLPNGVYLDAKPYYDKKCYYRYSERDFSIFQNELSPDEVQKLRSTIEMLSRYRGVPNNAWLEEVISNLEYRFGIKSNSDNVVAFEQNEQLKGLEYLSEVIGAAVNHTPLIIYYKTYKGKEFTSTLHPYHVKQYNNRWFLFGYEEESGKIANKALDRIHHISLANVPFKPNTSIDFGHFFDDFVGVSIPYDDVKKETVILRFTPARFPYVTSKPIHKSQFVIDEEDCTVSLEVKPTRELEQQILSFGPDVEVLSPDTFRVQVGQKIAENYKKYFPVQNECIEVL
ncbi:WYL domain-containing protein [Bacteroides pyogenes]|uniref:helix-turn-helix transcriptional regulator n=1 Tax=Bacteroides pyogenes TaxID=310300 RepID=UPI002FDB8E6E